MGLPYHNCGVYELITYLGRLATNIVGSSYAVHVQFARCGVASDGVLNNQCSMILCKAALSIEFYAKGLRCKTPACLCSHRPRRGHFVFQL